MRSHIERAVNKTLREPRFEIVFASLFGSFRRGDYDGFSDIDIFIVHEDEDERSNVSRRLKSLEGIFNRKIHVNLFSLEEFENRLRFHDYLTTSILEDSSFILGRRDLFTEAKRRFLEEHPSEESIRFNREMGFKTLRHLCFRLDDLDLSRPRNVWDLHSGMVKNLNDYRLALGYLYASRCMEEFGRCVSSKSLAETSIGLKLKTLADFEKTLKRRSKIDYTVLHKLAEDIKAESSRILSLRWDIKSDRMSPY